MHNSFDCIYFWKSSFSKNIRYLIPRDPEFSAYSPSADFSYRFLGGCAGSEIIVMLSLSWYFDQRDIIKRKLSRQICFYSYFHHFWRAKSFYEIFSTRSGQQKKASKLFHTDNGKYPQGRQGGEQSQLNWNQQNSDDKIQVQRGVMTPFSISGCSL